MSATSATALYEKAIQFRNEGLASDPATMRELLMQEREQMASEDRPTDDDLGRMVAFVMQAPLVTEEEPPRSKDAVPDASEVEMAAYLATTKLSTLVRWSCAQSSWMEWTGTYWRQSSDRSVPLAFQLEVRRAIGKGVEAHTIEPKAVMRLASAAGMRGIASLLAAWPSVWLADEIDPPGLLACPRGVLDLNAGEWLEHNSSRPITRCCPVDPGKQSPLWTMVETHLRECFGDLYPAVHRYLGSSLRGLGADRRVLWLHGPGGDGKSTLAKILLSALGQYGAAVSAEVFGDGGTRGAHGHELGANMAGARMALALEVGPRLDWAKLKSHSGGDEQRTKRLHGRSFSYRPPLLVLVSNDRPTPPDRASAERLIVAELHPPQDPDERLMEAIKSPGKERELLASACLQWLIDGCAEYQQHGLGPVALCAHAPVGLERWWAEAVQDGRIIPKVGRSSLDEVRAVLGALEPMPHNRDLAAFLKTVVEFKRTNEGSRYGLTVRSDSK